MPHLFLLTQVLVVGSKFTKADCSFPSSVGPSALTKKSVIASRALFASWLFFHSDQGSYSVGHSI